MQTPFADAGCKRGITREQREHATVGVREGSLEGHAYITDVAVSEPGLLHLALFRHI